MITGSVRPGNYTDMATAYVVDELRKHPKVSVEKVHPGELNLPFPGTNPDSPATKKLQQAVAAATGVILVTPEYHGSFSSVMKLVIENLGFPSVLAGKPVALLGGSRFDWGHQIARTPAGRCLTCRRDCSAAAYFNSQRTESFRSPGPHPGTARGEGGAPGRIQPSGLHREKYLPCGDAREASSRRRGRKSRRGDRLIGDASPTKDIPVLR